MLDTPAGSQIWRGPPNSRGRRKPAREFQFRLTVFETFASNNMRKRTLHSLTEVYQVATINPWSNTAIAFNASDEPKFRTARAPAALVLSPIVDGCRLAKVLMDGGSGLNLI